MLGAPELRPCDPGEHITMKDIIHVWMPVTHAEFLCGEEVTKTSRGAFVWQLKHPWISKYQLCQKCDDDPRMPIYELALESL